MMGKLILFEWKKIVGNKFFKFVFLFLLFLNMVLWVKHWDYFGVGRKSTELSRLYCETIQSMSDEQVNTFQKTMMDQYGKKVFDEDFSPPTEMISLPGYFDNMSDYDAVRTFCYLNQVNANNEKLYKTVVNSAKKFGREALKSGNDYEVRRNLNIIRRYSVAPGKVHSIISSWQDFFNGNHTMLLVLCLELFCCAGIFSKEIREGTWLLLRTSKDGKEKIFAAKILSMVLMLVVTIILFQASSLLILYLNQGFLGGMEPIVSLEQFRLFPLHISIVQYALLMIGCQFFSAVIMAVLLCVVSACCDSELMSYVIGLGVIGISLLLLYADCNSEWILGPLGLLRPEKLLESYITVNIFGYPILTIVYQMIIWSMVAIISIVMSVKFYHRKRSRL